ncbi:MAG: NUDIX domain-containing protein [Candidatus Kerfeldbacteria bacterium]|nr:NUDIX domain-containing protein [Candidatus Kerfeldbacteria bacterium]
MTTFPRGVEVVGSAVIEDDKGRILLARSPQWSNKWVLPGGHIEPGETIMAALVREAEEETGLKLKPVAVIAWGELLGSKDFERPAHFIYFDIYAKVAGGMLELDGEELTESQWVTPEKAKTFALAESYAETIDAFIRYRTKQ